MTVSISPVWAGQQFFDSNGNPLAGGKIYQYENGSFSVQQTTYSDQAGTIPNTNPIVLDSAGRITVGLFLTNGLRYNLVLTDADDDFVENVDGVIGVTDYTDFFGNPAIWLLVENATVEYVSATSFRIDADFSADFAVGNRAQVQFSDNTAVYGTVDSVSWDGSFTYVNLDLDSGSIVSSIQFVYWSAIDVVTKPGDAGALTYTLPATYTNPRTIGYHIKQNSDTITNVVDRLNGMRVVYTASGTNNYTVTITPTFNNFTYNQVFTIKFTNASTSTPLTLNVNSIGATPLQAFDSTGVLGNPTITAGLVSDVAYNGSVFVLLDVLVTGAAPPPPPPAPHGIQVFNSNGNFTVPSNVYFIEVTAVAGGGGGGSGNAQITESGIIDTTGGTGGAGGIAIKSLSVTPGDIIPVSIGAGGAGGSSSVPGSGASGGNTTFGANLCQAGGGSGGTAATAFGNGTAGAIGVPLVFDYGELPPQIITSGLRGTGGVGGTGLGTGGTAGNAGTCIVKW